VLSLKSNPERVKTMVEIAKAMSGMAKTTPLGRKNYLRRYQ
jgi:hypothetical protein